MRGHRCLQQRLPLVVALEESREARGIVIDAAIFVFGAKYAQQQDMGPSAPRVIIFVWDGLRTDDLTPEITPNFFALALGEHDMPDWLLIPEKLYGRQREVETLLASFNRVVNGGGPELVLISGHAGIGKSSVVNELQKALVPPRGLFASGKFDQRPFLVHSAGGADSGGSSAARDTQARSRGLEGAEP